MSKFKALFEEANQDQPVNEKKAKKKISAGRGKPSGTATNVAIPVSSRVKGRRSDPNYTGVFAYIPVNLHDDVKLKLFRRKDLDFSALVEELLANWLAEQK